MAFRFILNTFPAHYEFPDSIDATMVVSFIDRRFFLSTKPISLLIPTTGGVAREKNDFTHIQTIHHESAFSFPPSSLSRYLLTSNEYKTWREKHTPKICTIVDTNKLKHESR